MATQRAFAWTEGGGTPANFTANEQLIFEDTPGSAGVALGQPGGPEGYTYWPGPDETAGQKGEYMIAFANRTTSTHTGANSVASNMQFWGSDDEAEFKNIATNITNQGFENVDPATFVDTAAILTFYNNIADWQAFDNS